MKIIGTAARHLHWINLPGLVLLALLQRTPVLRFATVVSEALCGAPLGAVLRPAVAAAASLGALHSLAGATQFVQSPVSPVRGTVGTTLSVGFTITGSPTPPNEYFIDTLPPGLATVPAIQGNRVPSGAPVITGIPTRAGTYNISVTGSDGVHSQTNIITFVISASGAAPVITAQPGNQTVIAGATATFSVVATGTPTPTYQWRKGGSALGGATAAALTLADAQIANAGSYDVVVTNSLGSVTSSAATLTVNVPPSITAQPTGVSASAGLTVSFTAAVSGVPAPALQWQKNGVNLSGATAATLTLGNLQPADAGLYALQATNVAGTATSVSATLTVNAAPSIATQPVSQTVNAGTTVTFVVAANGTPAPSYQWRKNGAALAGATQSTLTLAGVQPADAGSYVVVVANGGGSVTSTTATLTVSAAPVITTQPLAQTVTAGAAVTLVGAASGVPAPNYQWRKNGIDLAGATAAALSFSNVQAAEAGSYVLVATNLLGTAASNAVTLTVNVAPSFTAQPLGQTVGVGSTVTLVASATGMPTPTYQWRRQGSILAGATGPTLVLPQVQLSDAGDYTVTAGNVVGVVTSAAAKLTVNAGPGIVTQPVGQSVAPGATVVFSVAATGTPPPTYQWLRNGVVLAGATNPALTLSAVQVADAATYTVIATNPAGSTTSDSARLTILLAPTITMPPASQSGAVGDSISFVVGAGGVEPLAYQWFKDGSAITGATSPTLMVNRLQAADAGRYTVRVSNLAGAVTSAAADLVISIPNPGRIVNLSILTSVTEVEPLFTVGTVVGGGGTNGTKPLLVRAAGPSLTALGVAGALADARLEMFSGSAVIAANNDWAGTPPLVAAFGRVGAFAFASANSRDAAVFHEALPAGAYTVQVGGVDGATGLVIAELYDASPAAAFSAATPRLVNVSVLKQIGAGNALTAGFVIGGATPKTVLLRVVGPTLAEFGVSAALADPQLELFSGAAKIDENDDWGGGATLTAAFAKVGAFALANAATKDAALLITLGPGSYTAQASGRGGAAGVALVEIYEVP